MLRIFLIFFSVFSFSNGFSQQNISQKNVLGDQGKLPLPEEMFVHTDKSFYVSGEVIWFKVYVLNQATHKLQNISHTAYVEVINKDNVPVLQGKVRLDSGTGTGSFYLPVTLESGNFVLRAYTNWMKNDPGSVFKKSITVINTRKEIDTSKFHAGLTTIVALNSQKTGGNGSSLIENIQIATNQTTYQPRTAVKILLNPLDSSQHYHLSASVYHLTGLNQPNVDISFPAYLKQSTVSEENSGEKNNVASGKDLPFLPELNGMVVVVAARKTATNSPAPDVPVYLSVRGKVAHVKVGKTNKNGLAYFNFRELYGTNQLVIQTDQEFQSAIDFNVEKSYLTNTTPVAFASTGEIQAEEEAALESLHAHTMVNDTYFGDKQDSFPVVNQDSSSFYGKPYKTYLLDNYKRFVTMEEVLREYVAEVNVRIKDKDYHFQTFNRQFFDLGKYMTLDYMMTNGSPLVLLDGVPVFDNNKIMKYNPLLVRKLDVVADRFHIGPKAWNGVMSFVTYKGMLEDYKLDPKDVVVDFDGWQRPRNFYAPNYGVLEIKNSRLPDFRNVLYWNPDIKMNKGNTTLQFFTGDLAGKFVIVIQGISDAGVPVFASSTFEVAR